MKLTNAEQQEYDRLQEISRDKGNWMSEAQQARRLHLTRKSLHGNCLNPQCTGGYAPGINICPKCGGEIYRYEGVGITGIICPYLSTYRNYLVDNNLDPRDHVRIDKYSSIRGQEFSEVIHGPFWQKVPHDVRIAAKNRIK